MQLLLLNRNMQNIARQKEAGTIYENYGRRKSVLDNQYKVQRDALIKLQTNYKEGEYGTGEQVIFAYADEYRTLSNHNLIEYEEKLNKAKEACELDFEKFPCTYAEKTLRVRRYFQDLNKALRIFIRQ